MKVLYLTYDGLTDPLGQSQVLPYIQKLAAKGVSYTVVSFEKQENFQRDKHRIDEIIREFNIEWVPLKYHKEPPVFSTLYDLRKLRRTVRKLVPNGIDIIHCRSYITALVGLEMKEKYGTKFLFDMRGFWADERIEGNIWDKKNPVFNNIYKFFKKKEKQFFERSDVTVSLTHNAAKYISQNFDVSKIDVIPCCVDLEHFVSHKSSPQSKTTIIGYIGSLGTWYMVEEMLQFFKVYQMTDPDSLLRIITRDDTHEVLEWAKQLEIADSVEFASASRDEIPGIIDELDAVIMFIKPVFSKRASSPTKLGEVMAMNKPVVCNSGVGDMDTIVNERIGVVVSSFDNTEFESASIGIRKLINEDLHEPRQLAQLELSLETGVNKYFEFRI